MEKIRLNLARVHAISVGEQGLAAVIEKVADIFKDELGSMNKITAKLSVQSGCQPRFIKARNVPYALRPKVEAEIKRLTNMGVFSPVPYSDWATPLSVMVRCGCVVTSRLLLTPFSLLSNTRFQSSKIFLLDYQEGRNSVKLT